MTPRSLGGRYRHAPHERHGQAALLVLAHQLLCRVEPPAGLGQRVHRIPLPRLRLREVPLSGDSVPARFDPLGVERAHRIVSGLHGCLGVREVELGLPVRSLGVSKCGLCQAQLTRSFPSTLGRWISIVVLHQPIVSNLDELDGPVAALGTSLPPGLQLIFDLRTLVVSRCFGRYLNWPQFDSRPDL